MALAIPLVHGAHTRRNGRSLVQRPLHPITPASPAMGYLTAILVCDLWHVPRYIFTCVRVIGSLRGPEIKSSFTRHAAVHHTER
jgi:hypothetical protein